MFYTWTSLDLRICTVFKHLGRNFFYKKNDTIILQKLQCICQGGTFITWNESWCVKLQLVSCMNVGIMMVIRCMMGLLDDWVHNMRICLSSSLHFLHCAQPYFMFACWNMVCDAHDKCRVWSSGISLYLLIVCSFPLHRVSNPLSNEHKDKK